MLPLQQAFEVRHSIIDYLKATFSFKDKGVHDAFDSFINNPDEGIFKGPYISLKLPFVKSEVSDSIPLDIKPAFPPYDHQYKAFQRLTTKDEHIPQSTLITTGTSSGKTECFLYPILDYCFQHQKRKGIKVIILYPMNALATDQAKRLAETIYQDERLKGKITAGLFIGEGKAKKKYPTEMGEHNIIENRYTIVENPPDIILTNFKMLDYALMRNNYHKLWEHNLQNTDLLQFLVLDELHTYDGAQGTDVANLIRRLKLKLGIPKGQICAVGTSATIGGSEDSKNQLLEYASKVYGEDFDKDSIISENRQTVNDFFQPANELDRYIPRQIGLLTSRLGEHEEYPHYIQRQKALWQIPESTNQVMLAEELKKLKIVRDMADLTSSSIKSLDQLIGALADCNEEFNRVAEWDASNTFNPREEIINSLLALISEAKSGDNGRFPFLFLQVQLWIRELSGVLREIGEKPKFLWKESIGGKDDPQAMPAYFCRECGASGWLGVKDDNKNIFSPDPSQVYEYFFSNHKNTYFINTAKHPHIPTYEPDTLIHEFLDRATLQISETEHDEAFAIHAVRKLDNARSKHICPECNTENTLGIIGTRVATLSSITVSQVLASDLDPRDEKYRKILAFTNSVQDAAHQAAFIEARNYRFTFRASLQKVINSIHAPVSLDTLQDEFIRYWKTHADETTSTNEEAYYFRFMPDDYKGKVDITTDFREHGLLNQDFKREFDLRMKWEVISEFGYNALIGRTLEKSEASATKFDEQILKEVYPRINKWLVDNLLSDFIEVNTFPAFINGFLHRIRTRGGTDHPYFVKFRQGKQELRELNWWQDSRHFLNRNFGKRTRLPKLLTNVPHSKGMLDTTHSVKETWFYRYLIKSFQLLPKDIGRVNDFYFKLLDVLTDVGVLNKVQSASGSTYAIEPKAIIIEKSVKVHQCDKCTSVLYVAESDKLTQGSSCLDYQCTGKYQALPPSKPNYYQAIYNRNRSPRIRAAEHTGILERKDRENKEFDFKERPNFNSLNAIVATSTLEMGIDIGTLNTAINNSIPPQTSNFLQRVGRAGRSSGSALLINFAQNKPHDLFYYNAPSDMMEGEIATPACFMEAKDILFRHFLAFCFDKWSSADPIHNSIPRNIFSLRLFNTDIQGHEFFGNKIISFIKSNEQNLLNEFCSFYQPDIHDEKVFVSLRENLSNETLSNRVKDVFVKLKSEYTYIFEKRSEIDDFIKSQKLGESDQERKILDEEKKALWGLKRIIDQRSLLEHLTNVGLLPNYAFPETGVTLNAWIKNIPAKGSSALPIDNQFEIVRSASSAIRELAPENYFYSQGFKFQVSGLNTHDWREEGTLIKKRFCSNCDNLEDAINSTQKTCPKCGDASWSSINNIHTFVRLSGVKSFNFKPTSTLDDSSDEREALHYNVTRHIKFDNSSRQGAWGMKDIPFGIEYVKNVKLTSANLGLSSSVDANKITINNVENIPSHGFITCKYCGKSTSSPHKSDYEKPSSFHFGYCKHKNSKYEGKSDGVFEEVFLYREFNTEAMKILLPVQELDEETKVNLFKAGLELGLKKYYKGNPQHLSILDYREYNEQNSRFDRYVIICDNISGGTGYLEKLFNPQEFTQVLKLAHTAIKDCSCKTKGKDGCYRCIYTYANQRNQRSLSRALAEKMFENIVAKTDSWESYTTGLGSLSGNGQIEESELEERFIRSLRKYVESKVSEGWVFEETIQDGVLNYKIQMRKDGNRYSYYVRPQMELNQVHGVAERTRTDFYITLTDVNIGGESIIEQSHLHSFKNIAIYLDGYTYHASKENQRFIGDLKKRQSILNSGDKITWSLTWSDLELFDEINPEKRNDEYVHLQRYNATKQKWLKIPNVKDANSELFTSQNSFERLLWLLLHPIETDCSKKKLALFLATMQEEFGKPSCDEDFMQECLSKAYVMQDDLKPINISEGRFFVFPNIQLRSESHFLCKTGIKASNLEIQSRFYIADTQQEIPKESWESFWRLYNLLQESVEVIFESNEQMPQESNQF